MGDYTSLKDEQFFGAIGRLTISWAHLEAGLDFAIEIAHKCFGGKNLELEPPRTALNRKVRFLRKWAQTIPEPTFQKAVVDLMDDITQAADTRHDLIHGFVIEHAEGTGEAKFARILRSAEKDFEKKYYNVTTSQILKAAIDANKLATRALRLGTGLQEGVQILLKEIHESHGKL